MPEQQAIGTPYGLDVGSIFSALFGMFLGTGAGAGIADAFVSFWQIFSIISYTISAILLFGVIYARIRHHELHAHAHHMLHEAEHQMAELHSEHSKNKRWQDALEHIESDNPNDWRLAIIEADIMLEEMLDSLGFAGLTIGDKLKNASPKSFTTIDEAWRAHKVRNEIAHRGTDFVLTKRIAKETLEQYRRVFEEFSVI